MKTEDIARVAHEVNAAFCRSIGDDSQPEWVNAPGWQRDSAVNGVEFHLAEPRSPEDSHKAWMKEKFASGWAHGLEKDTDKKIHPCLVHFDELPKEQQAKDILFKSVVDSLSRHHEQSGSGTHNVG